MRLAVVGTGAVGVRAARHALAADSVDEVAVVSGDPRRARQVARSMGEGATPATIDELRGPRVVILAGAGPHHPLASRLVAAGCGVVSTSGRLDDVEALLALEPEALERDVAVVPGAAMAPGLACLLAAHAAAAFHHVTEVRTARAGSGGRACAVERAHTIRGDGWRWSDAGWEHASAGGGRELMWFPEPVGGRDCRYGALPEAVLLHRVLGDVARISARIDAGGRERAAAWAVPDALRRGKALGAVSVEVTGDRAGTTEVSLLGAVDRPGVAAGALAALAAVTVGESQHRGVMGPAELGDPGGLLAELAERGVKVARFVGSAR